MQKRKDILSNASESLHNTSVYQSEKPFSTIQTYEK